MKTPETPPPSPLATETFTPSPAAPAGNIAAAVGVGFIAALIGAAFWAAITVSTGYKIGFIAIGIGLLVGFGVRAAGKGTTDAFAATGGIFALLGCVIGNLFTVVALVAQHGEHGFFSILFQLKPAVAFELMKETFTPMDVLFYAIAVYEGFKFGRIR